MESTWIETISIGYASGEFACLYACACVMRKEKYAFIKIGIVELKPKHREKKQNK